MTDSPVTVTVSVVTVIRADEPFETESAAETWLGRAEDSDFTGELLEDALGVLQRARAAHAAAAGVPFGTPVEVDSLLAARVGFGPGEEVASGRFLQALDVDARGGTASRRRERAGRTGSLARTARILGGKETAAACEVLVPRVRLDLDSGNDAAARLTAAPAVAATITELEFAVDDEDHERDLDRLEELLPGLRELQAEPGPGPDDSVSRIEEALEVSERVIRRRRILDQ